MFDRIFEYTSDRYHCELQHVPLLENYFNSLLVVTLFIDCKIYFLLQGNKTYQSIYKSILVASQIVFDIALNNFEATLKQI